MKPSDSFADRLIQWEQFEAKASELHEELANIGRLLLERARKRKQRCESQKQTPSQTD